MYFSNQVKVRYCNLIEGNLQQGKALLVAQSIVKYQFVHLMLKKTHNFLQVKGKHRTIENFDSHLSVSTDLYYKKHFFKLKLQM